MQHHYNLLRASDTIHRISSEQALLKTNSNFEFKKRIIKCRIQSKRHEKEAHGIKNVPSECVKKSCISFKSVCVTLVKLQEQADAEMIQCKVGKSWV